MKKLLGVLLAIAMSWPVNAAVLKNVEVVGEIQTIASDVRHDINYIEELQADPADNQVEGLYNRMAWTRAMAGLSADVVEDVTANILFQYAYAWGTNNQNGFGFGASGDDEVRLVNANVTLHNLFCAFDLTVGRQFYGDEDSAVMYFGPNHYNAETGYFAKALDAAKLVYADDVKSFTMIAGTIYDSDDSAKPAKFDIYGADFKLNLMDSVTAQVYGYDVKSSGADRAETLLAWGAWPYDDEGNLREDNHHGFYGAKLAANMEAFRASAEYARNFGGKRLVKEHNPTGHMFKADIAADINMLTARGAFYYANEDFWSFGNYTPGLLIGHPLGGNLSGYSDEGMRMFNLGFDVKPFEKWVFSVDGYAFQGTHGNHSATWEADLTAKYNHNEYVQLFAGIGYAKYGNDYGYFAKEGYAAYSEDVGDTTVVNPRRDNVKGQIGMLIKF